jgi:hypothetical protein
MSGMGRREFIGLVGGSGLLLAAKARRARAQQARKQPTIGLLSRARRRPMADGSPF